MTVFFFAGFDFSFLPLRSINSVAVPATSTESSVAPIHARGGPMTFLATTDIGSSWPSCSQYRITRWPSE